mgnify:CR=1 FL=1
MKLKTGLQIFGGITVIFTLLPFIAIDYWWIRVFDFPHFQLTILTLIALVAYLVRFDLKNRKDYIFMVVLVSCFIYQLAKIYPYTPLAQLEVQDSSSNGSPPKISIYTANVLQSNSNREKVRHAIKHVKADILLFTETDKAWKKSIEEATAKDYKYKIGMPLANTYGMLLYSKFPLINPAVKFLIEDSIPSIHTLFVLPTGDTIQLYAIHPSPPMPQHNPSSTDRDAELMKIAKTTLKSNYPVLVIGDFNDVAWSESTENFQEVSRLLDPRKGRGFYNTYHADYFFMRWPLDHIFVSAAFRVTEIRREKSIDSDHFPIFANFTFEPNKATEQLAPAPTQGDLEQADKQIESEIEADKQ